MHDCLTRQAGTKRKPCSIEGLMPRLADKWPIHVVAMLFEAENNQLRYSEIKNGIDGISQKMLTATLRRLERDGLVARHVFVGVPPRVEYQLTELGRGLLPSMKQFMEWMHSSWSSIWESRAKFDTQRKQLET